MENFISSNEDNYDPRQGNCDGMNSIVNNFSNLSIQQKHSLGEILDLDLKLQILMDRIGPVNWYGGWNLEFDSILRDIRMNDSCLLNEVLNVMFDEISDIWSQFDANQKHMSLELEKKTENIFKIVLVATVIYKVFMEDISFTFSMMNTLNELVDDELFDYCIRYSEFKDFNSRRFYLSKIKDYLHFQ